MSGLGGIFYGQMKACFSHILANLPTYLQMNDHDRYYLQKSAQTVTQALRLPPKPAPLTGRLLQTYTESKIFILRFLQSAPGWFKGRFSTASCLIPQPEVPYPVPEPASIVRHSFELQLKAHCFLLLSATEVMTLQQKKGETLPKRSLKPACQRPQISLLLNFQQASEHEHIVFLKTSPFWQKRKKDDSHHSVSGWRLPSAKGSQTPPSWRASSKQRARAPSRTPALFPRTPTTPSGPKLRLPLIRGGTQVFKWKQNCWLR